MRPSCWPEDDQKGRLRLFKHGRLVNGSQRILVIGVPWRPFAVEKRVKSAGLEMCRSDFILMAA